MKEVEIQQRINQVEQFIMEHLQKSSWLANGGPFGGPCVNFDGSNDYIVTSNVNTGSGGFEITNKITLSVWVKSDTSTWNNYAFIMSKRNSFIIHPFVSERRITFFLYIGGAWRHAEIVSNKITEITGWHLYTGTMMEAQ